MFWMMKQRSRKNYDVLTIHFAAFRKQLFRYVIQFLYDLHYTYKKRYFYRYPTSIKLRYKICITDWCRGIARLIWCVCIMMSLLSEWHLSYIVDTKTIILATQGARASAGMVLTYLLWNTPVWALKFNYIKVFDFNVCGAVITQSIFSKNSDFDNASVTEVLYEMSCSVEPRYITTRLCLFMQTCFKNW